MIPEKIELLKLTPSEGMHLKNIHTNEVYDSFIYVAKELSEKDFTEITSEEYQTIKEAEREMLEENTSLPETEQEAEFIN